MTTSWASIAKKSIPENVTKKIDEEQFKLAEERRTVAKRQEHEKLENIMWNTFSKVLMNEHGLKKIFDAKLDGKIIFEQGDFWYFYVRSELYKKKEDGRFKWNYKIRDHISKSTEFNEYVQKLQNGNKKKFKLYLYEVYGEHWLERTEDTVHDCSYLWKLRDDKRIEDEDEYYEMEANYAKWSREIDEALDKEEAEKEAEELLMKNKLKAGEITVQEYSQWKRDGHEFQVELEEAMFSHFEYYSIVEQHKREIMHNSEMKRRQRNEIRGGI